MRDEMESGNQSVRPSQTPSPDSSVGLLSFTRPTTPQLTSSLVGFIEALENIDTTSPLAKLNETTISDQSMTKYGNERSLSVGRLPEKSPAYQPNIDALEDLTNQQIDLDQQIAALEEKIANPSKIKVSKDEFLNLVKSASDKMKAGSAVEKDVLCRILFLNLRVDNEKVASYLWREPFATLVKATEIQNGGGAWT